MIQVIKEPLSSTGYVSKTISITENTLIRAIKAIVEDSTSMVKSGYVIEVHKRQGDKAIMYGTFTAKQPFLVYGNSFLVEGGSNLNFTCKSVHNALDMKVHVDFEVIS